MGIFSIAHPEIAKNITFVCTGNICRSAYGAATLRSSLEKAGNKFDVVVDSAGTFALNGNPMDNHLEFEAQQRGADTSHVAKTLTESVIMQSGFILALSEEHRTRVLSLAPSATKRVYLLSEFSFLCNAVLEKIGVPESWEKFVETVFDLHHLLASAETVDVEDPYRKDREVHVRVAEEIDRYLEPVKKILL